MDLITETEMITEIQNLLICFTTKVTSNLKKTKNHVLVGILELIFISNNIHNEETHQRVVYYSGHHWIAASFCVF